MDEKQNINREKKRKREEKRIKGGRGGNPVAGVEMRDNLLRAA